MISVEKIETRLFINGKVWAVEEFKLFNEADGVQFVESSDGKTFPLRSPTTREIVAEGMLTPKSNASLIVRCSARRRQRLTF